MPEDKQVSYGWRDLQYQKFYEVVDHVTEDIQSLEWSATGKIEDVDVQQAVIS